MCSLRLPPLMVIPSNKDASATNKSLLVMDGAGSGGRRQDLSWGERVDDVQYGVGYPCWRYCKACTSTRTNHRTPTAYSSIFQLRTPHYASWHALSTGNKRARVRSGAVETELTVPTSDER